MHTGTGTCSTTVVRVIYDDAMMFDDKSMNVRDVNTDNDNDDIYYATVCNTTRMYCTTVMQHSMGGEDPSESPCLSLWCARHISNIIIIHSSIHHQGGGRTYSVLCMVHSWLFSFAYSTYPI
jgi:hypothetical protein